MHKMPRIWLEYLEFLTEQKLVTRTRRTFDRALQSLPIMQHDRVWVLYLRFVTQPGIPVETALKIYRRYLMIEPGTDPLPGEVFEPKDSCRFNNVLLNFCLFRYFAIFARRARGGVHSVSQGKRALGRGSQTARRHRKR